MEFIRKYGLLIGSIVALLVLICFALLLIPEFQLPTVLQNSGLAAIISAFLGVVMTVAVTAMLLDKQAETQGNLLKKQSDTDAQKKKDKKIFDQKILVYSEFTENMWAMFDDAKVTNEKLKTLRAICFKKLVFHFNGEQIKEMTKAFQEFTKVVREIIKENGSLSDSDAATIAAGQIAHILRQSLGDIKNEQRGDLLSLFNSFSIREIVEEEAEQSVKISPVTQEQQQVKDGVTYWHFSMLFVEKQIAAFKQGNWVLNLIEYGEYWRTNLIEQVKPNDVIFLLKRGGSGYIGAFRAVGNPPYKNLNFEENKYSDDILKKYDIYQAITDDATLSSNILVKPIAYNCKGVGSNLVIPKTIQRINREDVVKFLLNRFNGKDLDENRLIGKGKFDDETLVELDENYFSEIIRKNNL
jgi:hypothetical protein